jgi:outer membrane protein assembly factor BamB
MLRGHLALSSEAARAPVADEKRLVTAKIPAKKTFAGKPTDLQTLVSGEWAVQINEGAKETPPVKSADGKLSYVAVTHEHRLECRDEMGKVVWAFAAGGRISQPPVLEGDLLLFGCHDGYAYAINAKEGGLVWKFLAAPSERNIVSHGQIESAYPVYNVVMFEGNACFTAGLHPEVGGGIWAWGVEPRGGKVVWHKVFKRSEVMAKPGTKIAPNRVLNSPLKVEGNSLAITGLSFLPTEADEAIQKRIDTSSLGDKLRNQGWTVRGTPLQKR